MTADDEPDLSTRGGRFKAVRKALGLTGDVFAARLNDAAELIGLPRYWTGPKVTNTEKGRRDISAEDAVIVQHLDPEGRGWTWIMFGVPLRKGEDAWEALARARKRAGRSA